MERKKGNPRQVLRKEGVQTKRGRNENSEIISISGSQMVGSKGIVRIWSRRGSAQKEPCCVCHCYFSCPWHPHLWQLDQNNQIETQVNLNYDSLRIKLFKTFVSNKEPCHKTEYNLLQKG